jgi:hypothetical protein
VERVAVALLALALAAQLVYGAWSDGLTNDEVLYVAAGHRHLAGDFRMNPTHPPLAKMLCALPLRALDVQEPPADTPGGELGRAFAFVHRVNRPSSLIRAARLPAILLTVALALLTWLWARMVLGVGPALFALSLLAFHPSLLAHGHLATTDVPAALCMMGTALAFWWWWRLPSLERAALVALAVGVGLLTRLTTGLLVPGFAVLLLLRLVRRHSVADGPGARAMAGLLAAGAVIVPLVIWSGYGFSYAPWPNTSVLGATSRLSLPGALLAAAARAHLLPEAFLESVRYQLEHNAGGHPGFLLGTLGKTGWWSFPFVAFAVKNTLVFVVATIASIVAWLSRPRDARVPGAHWALAAGLTVLAAASTRIQIGERYLLPVYPFLALLIAGSAAPWLRTSVGRRALAALLALHAAPVLWAAPSGYLSYFNALAGGRTGGHRVLLDSSLDWGQDLPRLAAWMRHEGVGQVQLGYHGVDDPARFGIAHEDLPGLVLYPVRPPAHPFSGIVVVSPNLLFGLVPRLGDPYAALRERPPDGRAGVFFVYRLR